MSQERDGMHLDPSAVLRFLHGELPLLYDRLHVLEEVLQLEALGPEFLSNIFLRHNGPPLGSAIGRLTRI